MDNIQAQQYSNDKSSSGKPDENDLIKEGSASKEIKETVERKEDQEKKSQNNEAPVAEDEAGKPINVDAPVQKEITEINLEQTNISENAEKQENKSSFYFSEEFAKEVNININNQPSFEGYNLHFHRFMIRDYRARLTGTEFGDTLSYIDGRVKEFTKSFLETRVAVVNNETESEEIALAAIERFISCALSEDQSALYSYTIDRPAISLDIIINSFRKEKKKWTGADRSGPTCLVIYGHKEFTEHSPAILKPVMTTGGIADGLTNTLTAANIFIIYLCNSSSLYRKETHNPPHASLFNLSPSHVYLYKILPEPGLFLKIIDLAEIVMGEYKWLSNMGWKEQKDKIDELNSGGQLELNLLNLINQTDEEEKKSIHNLAQLTINRAVLFTTAFFEGASIIEFNELVKCMLENQYKAGGQATNLSPTDDLFIWQQDPDTILANCGIVYRSIKNGFSCFGFENQARKPHIVDLFRKKYSLQLIKAYEIIEHSFLLGKKPISETLLKGIFELAFVNAGIDQERYLGGACFNLITELEGMGLNDPQRKTVFFRLLYYIRKWSDEIAFRPYLRRFYHRMNESASRRSIMGATLTYTCVPGQPENLSYLKSLLNAASEDEYFIKNKLTRNIAFNYIDDPTELFDAIMSWNEVGDQLRIPNCFAFAYRSLLLEFYGKRFNWTKLTGLDYQLIKRSFDDRSGMVFAQITGFLFPINSQKVFNAVFGPIISQQLSDSRFIDKAQRDSFFYMQAFILIQIYHLLDLIKAEDTSSSIDTLQKMQEVLTEIKESYALGALLSAMYKAVKKYNYLIINETEQFKKEPVKKATYKKKRDEARILIQLIEKIL